MPTIYEITDEVPLLPSNSPSRTAEIKPLPVRDRDHKVALVFGDLHLPFIDKHLWTLLCEFSKELQPDIRVWNGDLFDFYSISRFDSDPCRRNTMAKERDDSLHYIEQMLDASVAKDVALPGNHELRLVKYLWKHADVAMNLGFYDDLTWGQFLHLDTYEFETYPFVGVSYPIAKLGHLKVFHGDKCTKHAVVQVVEQWGCSIMFNHTHRMRSHYNSTIETTHGGWENGHLADTQALTSQYMSGVANWQQGFSVVYFDPVTGWFDVAHKVVCRVPGKDIKRFMHGGNIYECKA